MAALIAEWQPARLVVGIATHADGAVHETGRLARRFGQRLHGRFGIAVEFVDERLTSHAAEAALARGRRAGESAAPRCSTPRRPRKSCAPGSTVRRRKILA